MKLWVTVCLASLQLTGVPASTAPAGAHSKFDAHRLKTGTFIYRDTSDNGDVGQSKVTVEKIPGANTYSFSTVVSGKFSQRWRAVTTSGFDPISANLSFGEGSGTPVFNLNYTTGRVTGFVVDRKGPTAGTKRPVKDVVPKGIVDQRLDWAAVTASNLKSGGAFEFDVYDPSTGISHVVVRIGQVQALLVPAGELETFPVTYEIKKRTATECYRLFVSKEEPRILVREEFPDGTQSDLASSAP
jgi:hypothetical protein